MSTLDQINLFNLRYTNLTPVSKKYSQSQHDIKTGMTKPRVARYKSVNQLLTECPLVGSTKLGMNFIA